MNLKPDHPKLRGDKMFGKWFGDQRGICRIAARQTGQRAVASAFFFNNRLVIHIRRRSEITGCKRIQSKQV